MLNLSSQATTKREVTDALTTHHRHSANAAYLSTEKNCHPHISQQLTDCLSTWPTRLDQICYLDCKNKAMKHE